MVGQFFGYVKLCEFLGRSEAHLGLNVNPLLPYFLISLSLYLKLESKANLGFVVFVFDF